MRIAVFCGSSVGTAQTYDDAARELAAALVARGHGLVYGGASVGLMGVLANAVLERAGEVIGVIPDGLFEREVAHQGLTQMVTVTSLTERKAVMAGLADAFVALPGGYGTLDELFEMVTWAQLGVHDKPCYLFDVDGFWSHLTRFLEQAAAQGFIRRPIDSFVDADELLTQIERSHQS